MKTKFFLVMAASFVISLSCNGKKTETSTSSEKQTRIDSPVHSPVMDGVAVVRKYQIKSGIVAFETTMAGIKGKEILYFDDYGIKELVEKYSGNILKEATLADGTTMYKIKYDQKAAYKMGNASRGVAYKFDWNEISAADQGTKAKKLDNVTIAGKDCESYSYETSGITTTYAGWNNICLFTEQKMKAGSSLSKAINIEENAVIAAEKFGVPAGFVVK